MSPKVWVLAGFADNANVHLALACLINCVKVLLLGVNPAYYLFPCHAPLVGGVADVGDVFVAVHPVWFRNTCDLKFWHGVLPCFGVPDHGRIATERGDPLVGGPKP